MLLYHGKRIDSATVGTCLVAVQCEKCGCQYYYQLARIGTGAATAHYGIGTAAATQSSQQKSQRDLKDRLSREAELVPCPKCNWINEDLVNGYRLGRCRHAGTSALAIGAIGTASSLIAAWFISIGHAGDRWLLPYFLFAGPMVSILASVFILVVRRWVRSRIQPNQDFPLVPCLPPGSPPALLLDEEGGELRLAVTCLQDQSAGGWHEFQLGREQLPFFCCDCMNAATPGHGYTATVTEAINLEIPRCAACANRSRRRWWVVWVVTAAAALLLEYGILATSRLETSEFWIVFVACSLVVLAFALWVAHAMTVPVKIRIVDRSRGILKLRFRNRDFDPIGRGALLPGGIVAR